jgi:ribosomal protein S18 acetylase RimI-like enzyme
MPARRSARAPRRVPVALRVMHAPDLDAVVALDARVFGERRPAYFERRLMSFERVEPAPRAIGLVAEESGAIVGLVMGTLAYGEFGFTQVTALVDSIAVHPEYQRRGIGRALATAFIAESTALGAREVYTLVNWNAWDMLKFFDALGFSIAPTLPLRRSVG